MIYPTPASKLLPLIVCGVKVPCRRVRVKGGMRMQEHVYPHSPGAGIELLGRELYKIEVTPIFDANLLPKEYANLWPAGLKRIREQMEKGSRGDITIPTIGKIPAIAMNWEQEFDASRSLTSEEVSWNFTEDSANLLLTSQSIKLGNSLSNAYASLSAEIAATPPKKIGLWDAVMRAINEVFGMLDMLNMYSNLLESKLTSILNIFRQLDDTADELKDPVNWPFIRAFHNTWDQVSALYQDQKQLGIVTRYYTTRIVMSCGQLATILFGDSTRSTELLQLNGFDDPFEIKAGTRVRYYQIEEVAA